MTNQSEDEQMRESVGLGLSVLASLLVIGLLPNKSFAQTFPTGCYPLSSTYECMPVMATPYEYTHNTCGGHEIRTSEAESLQDEIEDEYSSPSICNLSTERIGWYTSPTTVGYCGIQSGVPDNSWGIEVHNVSKYIFRYSAPCANPVEDHDNNAVLRNRSPYCPHGWGLYSSTAPRCRRELADLDPVRNLGKPEVCCANPIDPSIGNKYQEETDYATADAAGLVMRRYYNSAMEYNSSQRSSYYWAGDTWTTNSYLGYSKWGKLAMHVESPRYRVMALDSIGGQWRHHYQRGIFLDIGPTLTSAIAYRQDGRVYTFSLYQGNFVATPDVNDRLMQLVDGRFKYTNATDESVETYLPDGRLESIRSRAGRLKTVSYDSCNRISSVSDDFGRSLTFNYDDDCSSLSAVYRIASITLPGGGQLTYGYNSSTGALISVTYPDSTARTYTYGGHNGRKLTGIIDEQAQTFASWTYDADGRPQTSQHGSGAGLITMTYAKSCTYCADWQIVRTRADDSLGASTRWFFAPVQGRNRLTQIEKPHPSGTGVMNEYWTHDVQGNIETHRNFRNFRTNFSYDLTRNLETSRTEGLNGSGTTTPETRTISTQWHPTFRLPALITEPGRETAITYDSNGNTLTKTITDTGTFASRTWTWTYDSYGHVLTEDGPRTDVSDVTTYTYYTCTTGYQCGQLETITNAAGHVTTYSTYNAHGQPLTIVDPNGVQTIFAYDGRQRLTSRSVGGEATDFTYWPAGVVKRVTLPDGSYVDYAYDAAHRLTEIADNEGNRIVYTLDAMGNRTAENVYDPSYALARTRTRVFNNLNRLFQELGAQNQTTQYVYDNNGNVTTVTDPLSRETDQIYDPLGRLKQIVDPLSGQTSLGYDAQDNLTTVTDPRGLVTQYARNGFGEVTQQTSPDTGITTNTYDSAGNLKTSKDARNKTGTYSYDALNRVTSVAYNDMTITYTYDQGADQKGRLSAVAGTGATEIWTYDGLGRVITKTQISNGNTKTITYQYDSGGRLGKITTPKGKAIVYLYANGKVSTIKVDGTTLLSNVIYEPFGPVAGWTWGNGTLAVRTYDLDGRVSQVDSAGLRSYTWDDADRITAIVDAQNSALNQSYGYDSLDRLTGVTKASGNQSFTYDANGNRLTYADGGANSTYTIAGSSNRLSSISGSQARTYTYNAVGAVMGDGSKGLAYSDRERLKSATVAGSTWSYYQTGLGERVRKKLAPSGNHYYVYDEVGHLIGEYNGNTLIQETVWLGDIPVASLRGVTYYVHTDHLNAPTKVTLPSNNAVRWSWDRDPFGTTTPNENPAGLGTFTYNLRLPGQFYDAETGLNYNYFRDYDPQTGRYIQSDPIGLEGGINTYGYAGAMPTVWIDPTGLKVEVRCRRVGTPNGGDLRSSTAALLGGEHCFVVVSCDDFDPIPQTTLSYLVGGMHVATEGVSAHNNDTVYSGRGQYRVLPVIPPKDSNPDCASCKFEKCVLATAEILLHTNYRIPQYSIWGPNSNSVSRRLVEICGGSVAGQPPLTGWNAANRVGF